MSPICEKCGFQKEATDAIVAFCGCFPTGEGNSILLKFGEKIKENHDYYADMLKIPVGFSRNRWYYETKQAEYGQILTKLNSLLVLGSEPGVMLEYLDKRCRQLEIRVKIMIVNHQDGRQDRNYYYDTLLSIYATAYDSLERMMNDGN